MDSLGLSKAEYLDSIVPEMNSFLRVGEDLGRGYYPKVRLDVIVQIVESDNCRDYYALLNPDLDIQGCGDSVEGCMASLREEIVAVYEGGLKSDLEDIDSLRRFLDNYIERPDHLAGLGDGQN